MKITTEKLESCSEDDLVKQVNKRLEELGDMAISVQYLYHHDARAYITKRVAD